MTALAYCTITGCIQDLAYAAGAPPTAAPLVGQVTIEQGGGGFLQLPTETPARVIRNRPYPPQIADDGTISVQVPATGQTGVTVPDSFPYIITFDVRDSVSGAPVFLPPLVIDDAPAGETVDLSEAGVAVTPGATVATGPRGKKGDTGADGAEITEVSRDGDGHLQLTLSDTSVVPATALEDFLAPITAVGVDGDGNLFFTVQGDNIDATAVQTYLDALPTVSYGASQTLTPAQKQTAQANQGLPSLLAVSRMAGAGAWDNFAGPNGDIAGRALPSGHVWRSSDANGQIVGGLLTPSISPAVASIAYVTHQIEPEGAEIEFQFTSGTTNEQNFVTGCCARSFGTTGDGGSLQLATYANGLGGDGTGYDWVLFYVEDPAEDPYPVIAAGNYASGMRHVLDGVTTYRTGIYRIGIDSVLLLLADGTIRVVTDPAIATYWGITIGIQLRRPNATDGAGTISAFRSKCSEPSRSQPTPGAACLLPGNAATWLTGSTPRVGLAGNGDLDIRIGLMAADWTGGGNNQDILTMWQTVVGKKGLSVTLISSGTVRLQVSLDGSAVTGQASNVAVPFANGTWGALGMARVAATGAITYYTATDLTALDASFSDSRWTQLGVANRTSTAGAMLNPAPVPTNIGRVNTGSGVPFSGQILTAVIRDGLDGPIWTGPDFRDPWSGVDAGGCRWVHCGSGWSWQLPTALITDAAAVAAALVEATLPPQTIVAVQAADLSVPSTTAVATDLTGTLTAGKSYLFEACIDYDATTAADLSLAWSLTGSATISWITDGPTTTATVSNGSKTYGVSTSTSTGLGVGGIASGTKLAARPVGIITMDATHSGPCTLTAAQVASDATPTVLRAGSWIRFTPTT